MTIRPGYGIESLHLRQTKEQLREVLGAPAQRRRSDPIREYWLYPKKHLSCIVSRRSGHVLSIFFERGTSFIASELFTWDQSRIRKEFGEPQREHEAWRLSSGSYVPAWFSYDEGFGFLFSEDGCVSTVSVFAKKHKARVLPRSNELKPALAA